MREKAIQAIRFAQYGLYARNRIRTAKYAKNSLSFLAHRLNSTAQTASRLAVQGPVEDDFYNLRCMGRNYVRSKIENVALKGVRGALSSKR